MEFSLADLFESVVDRVPERAAVVAGEVRLTFSELDAQANRLAHALQDRGLSNGDFIGLYLTNCAEYLEGMLACYKLGAVPINVNYRYEKEELEYLFRDATLDAVIFHRRYTPRIREIQDEFPEIETYVCVDDESDEDFASIGAKSYERLLAWAQARRGFAARSGDDLYVLYTGGTTGLPKGVMWRHEDIFFAGFGGGSPGGGPQVEEPEELARKIDPKAPGNYFMAVAPLMHGAAQWATFSALFAGNCVVLNTEHFSGEGTLDLIEKEKVSALAIVGDAMARPIVESVKANPGRWDLSSFKVLGSGGASFSSSVKDEIREQIPGLLIVDAFGSSEAGHQGQTSLADKGDGNAKFYVDERTVVLTDDGRFVQPGSDEVGTLALHGRIPLGYYNDPEKTAQTFQEIDGVRYVLPGDMARVDSDCSIVFLGRGSVCISSGGEKIFPEEVESALKSQAKIFDVLVVGVPDERFGERVAAIIQLREGETSLEIEEIRKHLKGKVAGFKAPREIHLVERVQRQPSGKPDYRWAKAIAESGDHRVVA